MDEFLRVEEYLAGKRQTACQQFERFVMSVLLDKDKENFDRQELVSMYCTAYDKVSSQFKEDCRVFKESCPSLRKLVDLVEPRDLKKIEDFKEYKLSLVFDHCDYRNCGQITKMILRNFCVESLRSKSLF